MSEFIEPILLIKGIPLWCANNQRVKDWSDEGDQDKHDFSDL